MRRRRHIVATARRHGNVVIGQTQRGNILLHTREKGGTDGVRAFGAEGAHWLRFGQASAVLFKALGAKKLGSDGCLKLLCWP